MKKYTAVELDDQERKTIENLYYSSHLPKNVEIFDKLIRYIELLMIALCREIKEDERYEKSLHSKQE